MAPRSIYWKTCGVAVAALSVLTFTPVVTPEGVIEPVLWGMPRTLWAGILVVVALVTLTLAGACVHPGLPDVDREPRKPDLTEHAHE